MASVLSINISKEKGVVKHPVREAMLVKDFGIEGDAHGGNWHRQISLLSQTSVDKMADKVNRTLEPGIFAENITVAGIDVFTLPIGAMLKVGEAMLEVTQIGKECHRHCQIFKEVGSCVMPKEGIFARVVQEGLVRPGDIVEVYSAI